MWLWIFWWCVDDHIAKAAGAPGIGALPIWVPLILSLAFAFSLDGAFDRARKKR
ncbi:hypothetical protein [Hyphomonas sp.]|uniref:hypothetical protein n=1 Tax=Hyphomonas sp. TaxID=87 RepID=UPI001E150D26|nr:hypothetical protein [Hyphomonas sp.]MBU4063635.1 hypothetical protein [Alphaproteobacteria bacterium]MBU4165740.1 hypothetical protein [Alphaproteobacteria bacterium]